MECLLGTFSQLGACKVLVIGDLLLDKYTMGKARRISPEAPIAVVQVHNEEYRPGGAGNVALNLLSLGATPVLVARIGLDVSGGQLRDVLESEGVILEGLVVQQGYHTPVKNRIVAENQQIVRVDHEIFTPISEMLEQQIIDSLPKLLEGVSAVAISDYGKGFLSKVLLSALIEAAKQRNIVVIADPKGLDFSKYQGVTVIKPNFGEAVAASGLSSDAPLELIAMKIQQLTQSQTVMITRSEFGISLFFQNGERHDLPVKTREVRDVTGAGDTVLAMLTCSLANGLDVCEAAKLCNMAAGIAIQRFGCARISLSDMTTRLLEVGSVNKVFDQNHFFALQHILKTKPYVLLAIEGENSLTTNLFTVIRDLAAKSNSSLLIYVHNLHPNDEFINVLASLHMVDFIINDKANSQFLCDLIEPKEIYVFEEGCLHQLKNRHEIIFTMTEKKCADLAKKC